MILLLLYFMSACLFLFNFIFRFFGLLLHLMYHFSLLS